MTVALYNCTIVYLTPAGHRAHFYTKAVAQAADLALELAQRHLTHDTRRKVREIVYMEAIEQ